MMFGFVQQVLLWPYWATALTMVVVLIGKFTSRYSNGLNNHSQSKLHGVLYANSFLLRYMLLINIKAASHRMCTHTHRGVKD